MAKIYKSVEELIGNTPLLELTKIEKETGATLLAKVEALNPGGSAKDRIAKRMVEDAEKAGIIITCFDVAFGLTCHYYAKQHQITTVNLTTTFLKPVFLGDVVEYRVRITHLGRTLVSMMAEGHVNRKGKDVLIGTATATFMKLDKTFDHPI